MIRSELNFPTCSVTATYCIKNPSEDQFVSRGIASGGWEVEEVSKVLEAMTLHPGAVFLGKVISHHICF